jgi:hypothetical protein
VLPQQRARECSRWRRRLVRRESSAVSKRILNFYEDFYRWSVLHQTFPYTIVLYLSTVVNTFNLAPHGNLGPTLATSVAFFWVNYVPNRLNCS